ncbi:MAG TPA: glycogen debranching enzyme, partial [Pseudonocardiaceae bacterium]|nr:glycogen debranching enzyme [Pseudonocardiaceae bacterium]
DVIELRERQMRNLLATMLLAQGVPMLLHGDELGRTQQGNNNGYCQDNELTWVDWTTDDADRKLFAFTGAVTAFRHNHPVFRRRRFFAGRPIRKGAELRDIAWFTPSGAEMSEQDWEADFGRCITVFLNGNGISELDHRGEPVVDNSFLLCFNAHHENIEVTLPPEGYGQSWAVVLDTATGEVLPGVPSTVAIGRPAADTLVGARMVQEKVTVLARSLIVLQRND